MKKTFLKRLRLQNFRSYTDLELEFNHNIIIFAGPNGIGKTSILEALNHVSLLKSFRNASDKDIILWDKPHYSIFLEFENGSDQHQIHVGYGKDGNQGKEAYIRKLKINKELIQKINLFLGKFQTIVFSPDDLAIIDTTPDERRRFIDMLLSSVHPAYLENLILYRKILKNRSHYLRLCKIKQLKVDSLYLESMNEELARYGSVLMSFRQNFIAEFQAPLSKYIKIISGNQDSWTISYLPSIHDGQDQKNYLLSLKSAEIRDIAMGQTTKGVHRDRFAFVGGNSGQNYELQQIASQGQKRTVALSLKMAQFDYTLERIKRTPVLLIDDVLNELDVNRRKAFISFLDQIGQAFITTTDINGLEEFIQERRKQMDVQVFQLRKEGSKIHFTSE